jgi:hypothetical protein
MRVFPYKLERARFSLWIEVVDVVPHISTWLLSESTPLVRELAVSPSDASELYFQNALLPQRRSRRLRPHHMTTRQGALRSLMMERASCFLYCVATLLDGRNT